MNSFLSSSSSAGPSPSSPNPAAVEDPTHRVSKQGGSEEESHDEEARSLNNSIRVGPSPSNTNNINYRTYTLSSAAFSSRPPSVPASVLAKVKRQQHARISADSSASSSRHGSPMRLAESARGENAAPADSSPLPRINTNHSPNASRPLPFESSASPVSSPSPAHHNRSYLLMTSEQSPPLRYTHAFSADGLDGDAVEATDNGSTSVSDLKDEARGRDHHGQGQGISSVGGERDGAPRLVNENNMAEEQRLRTNRSEGVDTDTPSTSSSPRNSLALPAVGFTTVSSHFQHPSLAAIRSRSNSPTMTMMVTAEGGGSGGGAGLSATATVPRLPRSRAGSFTHPSMRNAVAEASLTNLPSTVGINVGGITTPQGGGQDGPSSVAPSLPFSSSEKTVGSGTSSSSSRIWPAVKLSNDKKDEKKEKEVEGTKEKVTTATLQSPSTGNVQREPQTQTAEPLASLHVHVSQEEQRLLPPTLSSGSSFSLRDVVALEEYSSVLVGTDEDYKDGRRYSNMRVVEGEEPVKQCYSSPTDQQLMAQRLQSDFGEQTHCSPPPSSKWTYSRAEAFSPVAPIYRAAKSKDKKEGGGSREEYPHQYQYSLLSSSSPLSSSATPQRRYNSMHDDSTYNTYSMHDDSNNSHFNHPDARGDEKGSRSDTTTPFCTTPPLLLSPRQKMRMRREATAASISSTRGVSSATSHSSERRRRSAEQIRDTAEKTPATPRARVVFGSPPDDTAAEHLRRDEEEGGGYDHFYICDSERQGIDGFRRLKHVEQERAVERTVRGEDEEVDEGEEDLISQAQHLDDEGGETHIEIVDHRTIPILSDYSVGLWQQKAMEEASIEECHKISERSPPNHLSNTAAHHRFPQIERYLPRRKREENEGKDDDNKNDSGHSQNKILLRDPHHVLYVDPNGDIDGYVASSNSISERAGSGQVGRSLSIPSLRREEDLERKTQQVIEAARRARSERQDRWRVLEERLVHVGGLRPAHSQNNTRYPSSPQSTESQSTESQSQPQSSIPSATNEILPSGDIPTNSVFKEDVNAFPLARVHSSSPPQSSGMMLSPPCASPPCSSTAALKNISTTTAEINGGGDMSTPTTSGTFVMHHSSSMERTSTHGPRPPNDLRHNNNRDTTVRSHCLPSLTPDTAAPPISEERLLMSGSTWRRASSVSTLCFDNNLYAHNGGEGGGITGEERRRGGGGEQHRSPPSTTTAASIPRRIEAPLQPSCLPNEEETPRDWTTRTNSASASIDSTAEIEIHRLRSISRRVVAAPLPTSTDLILSSSSSSSSFSAAAAALAILKGGIEEMPSPLTLNTAAKSAGGLFSVSSSSQLLSNYRKKPTNDLLIGEQQEEIVRMGSAAVSDSSPMVTPAPREAKRAPRPSSRFDTINTSDDNDTYGNDNDDNNYTYDKDRSNSNNSRLYHDTFEGSVLSGHTLDLAHVEFSKKASHTTAREEEEVPVTRKFYAPSRSRSRSNGAFDGAASSRRSGSTCRGNAATSEPILCGWEKRPSEEPHHSVLDVEYKGYHDDMPQRAMNDSHGRGRTVSRLSSRSRTVDTTADTTRDEGPIRPTPTPIPVAKSLSRSSYTRHQSEKGMQEEEEERQRSAELTEAERRELSLLRQLYDGQTTQQQARGDQREDYLYVAQRLSSSEQQQKEKASHANTTPATRSYKGRKDQLFYRGADQFQEQQEQGYRQQPHQREEDLSTGRTHTAVVTARLDTTASSGRRSGDPWREEAERSTTDYAITRSSPHGDVYAGMNTSQTEGSSNTRGEGEGEVKGLPPSRHRREEQDQDPLNSLRETLPKEGAFLYNASPPNTSYASNANANTMRSPSGSSASPASSHFFSEMRERALAFQKLLEGTERRRYGGLESESSLDLQGGLADNSNNRTISVGIGERRASQTPFPAAVQEAYVAANGSRKMQRGYGSGDAYCPRTGITYASPTHTVEEAETALRAVSFPPTYEELFSASPQYVRHHHREESTAHTIAASHNRPYTYAPSTHTTTTHNSQAANSRRNQNPTVTHSISSPHTGNSAETKRRLIRELFLSNANILNNSNVQPQHILHTFSSHNSYSQHDQHHHEDKQGVRGKSTGNGSVGGGGYGSSTNTFSGSHTPHSPPFSSPPAGMFDVNGMGSLTGTQREMEGERRRSPKSVSIIKYNKNVKAMLRALKPMARLVLSELSSYDREGSGVLPAEACAAVLNKRLATMMSTSTNISLEDRENEGFRSPVASLLSPADVAAFATALSSINGGYDEDDDDLENSVPTTPYSLYNGNNATAGVVNYSDFVAKLMEVE